MLERGEIDLLPTLRKTPERAERFAFSGEPISNLATMLTVKAGNPQHRCGQLRNLQRHDRRHEPPRQRPQPEFIHYAEEHGFTYTPIYFDTDEELSLALRTG